MAEQLRPVQASGTYFLYTTSGVGRYNTNFILLRSPEHKLLFTAECAVQSNMTGIPQRILPDLLEVPNNCRVKTDSDKK